MFLSLFFFTFKVSWAKFHTWVPNSSGSTSPFILKYWGRWHQLNLYLQNYWTRVMIRNPPHYYYYITLNFPTISFVSFSCWVLFRNSTYTLISYWNKPTRLLCSFTVSNKVRLNKELFTSMLIVLKASMFFSIHMMYQLKPSLTFLAEMVSQRTFSNKFQFLPPSLFLEPPTISGIMTALRYMLFSISIRKFLSFQSLSNSFAKMLWH